MSGVGYSRVGTIMQVLHSNRLSGHVDVLIDIFIADAEVLVDLLPGARPPHWSPWSD